MASAAAEAGEEEKMGSKDEETASRKKGGVLDEATRPWACCNSTVCTKSFPPTCRCLDAVDRCAAACQQCEPSIVYPFRLVCNDEHHGDPGPTCPKDDEEPTRPWACCNSTVCTKSFPPTCHCLDLVDRCAAACNKCEPSIFDPSRLVCNDEYHGDPGPTCPNDDDVPSGASPSIAAAARLTLAFIALLFIQSR